MFSVLDYISHASFKALQFVLNLENSYKIYFKMYALKTGVHNINKIFLI